LKELPETTFVKNTVAHPVKQHTKIEVYIRKGTYASIYYSKMVLDLAHVHSKGDQVQIVQGICELYAKQERASVFIEGVANAGKSTIGYLLAKELKGSFCHTFNPCEPGDHISNLAQDVAYGEGPLIVVLEEVDILLQNIHDKKILLNPKTPTAVFNKATWSTFLDDMIFYKKIILIMTSNSSKDFIDNLDPAYLRPGRVQACYSMPNPF
jgi:hypothetical protein